MLPKAEKNLYSVSFAGFFQQGKRSFPSNHWQVTQSRLASRAAAV